MKGLPHRDGAAAPELGLQRVSWVRVHVGGHGVRCEVAGIAHRRPVVRTVSLRTATALAAGGVPLVVRSDRGGRSTASSVPSAPARRAG